MDSEMKIVVTEKAQDKIDALTIIEGTVEIISYIELTRHLHEIYQWYKIFNYNYDTIKILYADGDVIAINSHTIALLSAGKNITDSIETCIINSFDNGKEIFEDFKTNYLSKEYDENFSYRLLTRLRNFSQHCHIPVSRQNGSLCFDLGQIYDTPHYTFNNTLRSEAMNLIEEVAQKREDNLTLSYRYTMCAYTGSIYRIYKAFMNLIQTGLSKKRSTCLDLINQHPDIVIHQGAPELNGNVFYVNDDDCSNLHTFNINDDPFDEYTQILNDVIERAKVETNSC